MAIDLTKLQSTSLVPGFKNNDEYEGSFTISGTYSGQSMVITKVITLPDNTDIADILFQGRADGGFDLPTGNPRPNSAWFKAGRVYARANGSGYSNYPMDYLVYGSISGNQLTLTAASARQFLGTLTISAEVVNYKIIDYSVS